VSKLWAIARREIGAYFLSPVAYVVAAFFLLLSGYFFTLFLLSGPYVNMRPLASNMAVTLMFIVPILTMRLLSDEKRLGTDELLFTSPVGAGQIVLGKFIAAVTVYGTILALSGVFPVLLLRYGNPDIEPMLTGYLGLLLLGSAFIAVGIFASSITDHQVVAGVTGFALLLVLWLVGLAGESVSGLAGRVLTSLSMLDRLSDFLKGVVSSADVMFYLSAVFVFLFLAATVLEARRWSVR